MKGLWLAIFAVGVPLLLMLAIQWLMPGPAPAPPLPPGPAVQRTDSARSPQTRPALPRGPLTQQWPVELVPSAGMKPLPDARRPVRAAVPQAATSEPTPVVATRPAATPSMETRILDRIEDWLDRRRADTQGPPDSPRVVAAAYLAQGDYARAAKAYDRLLLENPKDADLIMGEVLALTRLGQYDDALPLLAALLERDPKHVAARYYYGVTLVRLDRREEAMAAFTQLLAIEPAHGEALFNLAILQQSLGRNQDAWKSWRKLTAQLPAQATTTAPQKPGDLPADLVCEAWFHRGEVEMALSQIKDAQACFLEVTRRSPHDARAWCNLGIAHAVLAEYDQAVPPLMEAWRLEPTLVAAMNELAYIHAAKYRDTRSPEAKQAVLMWCDRSLAVRSQQINILELRNALVEVDREPPPRDEPDESTAEPPAEK